MNVADIGSMLDFVLKVGAVVGLANTALFFVLKSRFQTKEEASGQADKLTERLDALAKDKAEWRGDHAVAHQRLDHRLTQIEAAIRSLPSAQQIHELSIQIERLAGKLAVSDERVSGFEDLLTRVETQVRQHAQIFTDAARGSR